MEVFFSFSQGKHGTNILGRVKGPTVTGQINSNEIKRCSQKAIDNIM